MTNDLHVSYDSFADVLYLSIGNPAPSISHPDVDGLIWRTPLSGDIPNAVTITDFDYFWRNHLSELLDKVSSQLHVSSSDLKDSLPLSR